MGDQFPTLILGADVTHPAVGSKDGISIAAVVGSIDKRFAEYRSSIRVQQGKKEVITDLEDMIVEILNAFKKRSPQYSPKRMLFYRDGVSEGQFGEVVRDLWCSDFDRGGKGEGVSVCFNFHFFKKMLSEIPAIKRAFIRCRLPAAPTLTFVIVSKRHHSKLLLDACIII